LAEVNPVAFLPTNAVQVGKWLAGSAKYPIADPTHYDVTVNDDVQNALFAIHDAITQKIDALKKAGAPSERWINQNCVPIDIFGFSRGAILAIQLAWKIQKFNETWRIRFLGLLDPVASWLTGYKASVPTNVENVWLGKKNPAQDKLVYSLRSEPISVEDAKKTTLTLGNPPDGYDLSHEDVGKSGVVEEQMKKFAQGLGVPFR
jgi:hypothetical protein